MIITMILIIKTVADLFIAIIRDIIRDIVRDIIIFGLNFIEL